MLLLVWPDPEHFEPLTLNQRVAGSSPAAPTTQFALSLIPETLREKPALARPIRRVVLAVRSLAGGIWRIQGPVSGRKNPVPGAM